MIKKETIFEHLYHLAELGDDRFVYDVINNSNYIPEVYKSFSVVDNKDEYNS